MKSNKKTVFITGAGGFIGANLTRRLCEDFEVHVIAKSDSKLWRLEDIKNKIEIHPGNLLDRPQLTELLSGIQPEYIFHLAAHGSYSFQNEADKIIETNINGTLNLLNASLNVDYKSLIITGTSSEYGFKNEPMKESDILEPVSFYAASKASATLLSQVFAKEHKKPINIVRPFSVYGPYEEPSRFIPTIINSLIKETEINITPGNQRRDFAYIEDVIDLYVLLMGKGEDLSGEIFNIGTGIEYTNDEVVQTLFKVTGRKVSVNKGAFVPRMWDTSHWVADISKTEKLLNWHPRFGIEQGLKETYDWFNNAKI